MIRIKQIIWNSIIFIGLGSSNAYSSFDQEQTEAIFSRETLSLLQKKLVEINSQTYKTYRDKNRVLVLGPTGSGKSTLVTYLAGIPLKVGQKLSGQKTLIAEAQLPGIEIGDGILAQTKVPAAWIDNDNDVVYWDCPGFLDTEGPAQEISNAAMIHKIVYNEEKRISDPVKILFVVPYEYITSAVNEDDTRFTDQLSRVTGMFPDEQLGRSLYLVVTQARSGLSIKDKLLQFLDNIQKPESQLREKDLSIVRSLKTRVMNNLFCNFPKPTLDNAVGSDYISDRNAINGVLYADYFPLRVALNLSPEASDYIGRLCATCQDHLISQFRRQGPEIIKIHFAQKMQREEYDEVRDQIERLKGLETAIRDMDSFTIAERLGEFVGLSARLEIEKTLHILEALRTLEGFQGVDVKGLMRNLLREVYPEIVKTVTNQLIFNIGKYIATEGKESIKKLESRKLLDWYQGLDETVLGVDIALEKFKEIDDTERIRRYITMKQYLQAVDGTVSFVDREVIATIRNAHAPYIVTAQAKIISEYESKIQPIEIQMSQSTVETTFHIFHSNVVLSMRDDWVFQESRKWFSFSSRNVQERLETTCEWIQSSYLDVAFHTTQGDETLYYLTMRLRPTGEGWRNQQTDQEKVFSSKIEMKWLIGGENNGSELFKEKCIKYDSVFSRDGQARRLKGTIAAINRFFCPEDSHVHIPLSAINVEALFRGTLPEPVSIFDIAKSVVGLQPSLCSCSGKAVINRKSIEDVINPAIFTCRLLNGLGVGIIDTSLERILNANRSGMPITRDIVINELYANMDHLNLEQNMGLIEAYFPHAISYKKEKVTRLPAIARGNEEIYQLLMNGKLIYRPNPNDDTDKIELRIADMINTETLEGEFDLKDCGNAWKKLSINIGYRKGRQDKNIDKIEIWFVPRFIVERELNSTSRYLKPVIDKWSAEQAPVGIFWTNGNWNDLKWYDCATCRSLAEISSTDLYESYVHAVCYREERVSRAEGLVNGEPGLFRVFQLIL